ncbi:hypothetical protein QE152_g26690 [Popillia japonica]|uniref:Uncharacterized protein n=1 Tax=Popillia japonica TaxID=7064 RepID=A0AAW1JW86_POPJA
MHAETYTSSRNNGLSARACIQYTGISLEYKINNSDPNKEFCGMFSRWRLEIRNRAKTSVDHYSSKEFLITSYKSPNQINCSPSNMLRAIMVSESPAKISVLEILERRSS